MRKFTLYQAARFSKISRYKLEQAIKEGLLKTIKGKGNVKCFIYEDELKNFLDDHGDQFIKHDFEEEKKLYVSPEINNFVSKEIYDSMVAEKERVIQLLQDQQTNFLPMLTETNTSKQANELRLNEKISMLAGLLQEALGLIPESQTKQKENIAVCLTEVLKEVPSRIRAN